MVKHLFEKEANVNDKSNNGYKEIVELLLEKGANVDEKEGDGWTVLILAPRDNNIEIGKLMLKKGAEKMLLRNFND